MMIHSFSIPNICRQCTESEIRDKKYNFEFYFMLSGFYLL